MATYSKYYKQQKQVSYDYGVTWENLNEYQKGELIENYSTDCGYIGQLERWINSGYTCDGYNKYNVEVKQVSEDGVTWTSTGESRRGSLVEVNSTDCGYVPIIPTGGTKWVATYTDGTTESATCDSTSAISNSEFYYRYKGLVTFEIGDCVNTINEHAFHACSKLTSITIPDSVTRIGNNAFDGCVMLPSITIPNGVTIIEYAAFGSCGSLTSIDIPSGVTNISYFAFAGCGLTSVTIPNNVTNIDGNAFADCRGLQTVTIGSSVTSLGYSVFQNCTSLTSVTIPDSVTWIGNSAFYLCSGLTSITCLATTPPTLGDDFFPDNYFFEDTNNCPIYVPAGSVNAYKTASRWNTYADRIFAIPT